MDKITFCTLKAKNVLSIGEEITIDYRTGKGLTYVYGENKDTGGKNGSGKSAILCHVLLIALFGKTINNTNNSYLYNRQANYKEGGYIELELIKNSCEHYRIFVELKPNKRKDACSLNFHIFKDNEDITPAGKYETLTYIEEEIIGCNFDIFKNAIVMSSSNLMNFFEMPKRIKNEYLQGIFSLDAIGESYQFVTGKLNDIKKNIKLYSDNLFKINKHLDEITQLSDNWLDKNNHSKQDIESKLEEQNKSLQSKLKSLDEDYIIKDYDKKKLLLDKSAELEKARDISEKKLRKINNDITSIKSDIKVNRVLIEKNKDLIDAVCNDCKPIVSKLFKLDEAKQVIEDGTSKLEGLSGQFDKLSADIEKIHKYLKTSQSIRSELDSVENRKRIITNEIKHIKSNIQMLTEQINNISNETNPYLSMVNDQLAEKEKVSTTLDNLTNINQYYGILKELFSENGVKQVIIQRIIEVLNNSIHSYLRQMGADFLVYFDNKLVYNFYTPSGPCEYSSFSAGERRKLDLAILFAFRDVLSCSSIKTNICIVDEILDSAIDSMTLDSVMTILKNKSKMDDQSIFVISHREGLAESDIFNHKIRIEKEHGNSTIIQEF